MKFCDLNIGDKLYCVNRIDLLTEHFMYKDYIEEKSITDIKIVDDRLCFSTSDDYQYAVEKQLFNDTRYQNIATNRADAVDIVKKSYTEYVDMLIRQAKEAEQRIEFKKQEIIKYRDYINSL